MLKIHSGFHSELLVLVAVCTTLGQCNLDVLQFPEEDTITLLPKEATILTYLLYNYYGIEFDLSITLYFTNGSTPDNKIEDHNSRRSEIADYNSEDQVFVVNDYRYENTTELDPRTALVYMIIVRNNQAAVNCSRLVIDLRHQANTDFPYTVWLNNTDDDPYTSTTPPDTTPENIDPTNSTTPDTPENIDPTNSTTPDTPENIDPTNSTTPDTPENIDPTNSTTPDTPEHIDPTNSTTPGTPPTSENPSNNIESEISAIEATPPGLIADLVEKLPNRPNITVEVGETVEVSFLVNSPYDEVELLLECQFDESSYPSVAFNSSNISLIFDEINHTHPVVQISGKHMGSERLSLITTIITNNDAAENITGMTLSLTANHISSPELSNSSSYNITFEKIRHVELIDISDGISAATVAVEMLRTTIENDASDSSLLLIIILGFTAGQAGCLLLVGTIYCLFHCLKKILKRTLKPKANHTANMDNFLPCTKALNEALSGT